MVVKSPSFEWTAYIRESGTSITRHESNPLIEYASNPVSHDDDAMDDQSEGTITSAVRVLRQIIEDSNEKLRVLAEQREKRRRKLALDKAYPSPLKGKGDQ